MRRSDRRDLKSLAFLGCACVAVAALVATCSKEASAQQCRPTDEIERVLREKYHEKPTFEGVLDNGRAMFRLWRNLETGSWSITMHPAARPHMACPMAGGAYGGEVKPEPVGTPS